VDLGEVKQRVARIWDQGDYSALSGMLRPAAAALSEACAVSAGQEVLDVAAGDGNFAIACAHEGAKVVASDLSPGMVERGRARAEAEGYEIEWLQADAEELPFDDERFDCVGSVFGAMIAPRPEVVARELFRVTRPGGTVGMTAWIAGGFTAELIRMGRRFAPPPPDLPVSDEWGVEETVRERFGDLAASLEFERRELVNEDESPEALAARLAGSSPPMVAARSTLSPEQYDAMLLELNELTRRFNEGQDGSAVVRSEYLLSVARKRG
jgi:ubiquinone/menaquinone biosynthesis C-methylase UbiE